jgi:hypothetical protein
MDNLGVPAPGRRPRALGPAAILFAVLLLLAPLPAARAAAGSLVSSAQRAAGRAEVGLRLRGWPEISGAGFTLRYPPALAAQAPVAAAALRRFEGPVWQDFDLPPATRVDAVLVTPGEMARLVGVAGGAAPLGAYYDGVVWLLAPASFLPAGPGLLADYEQSGPVAHELTHVADAEDSGGRVPAWLDEGLAQYEDWRLTGYVWTGAGFSDGVYSWAQLTGNFSALPDVPLAYRQALAATAAVCRQGPGTCLGVLRALRSGESVPEALTRAVGAQALARLEAGAAWRPGAAPQPGPGAGPAP